MKGKRFIVLGLGSFGYALAVRLSQHGCRVTAVDQDERRIEMIDDTAYEAIVADVTDRSVLEQLQLPTAEAVFISLGEDIEKSILASLHAKELGAKQIYVKGVSPEHGRILRKLDVTRVIFPEVEMAEQTADQVAFPNVLEFFQFDPEYSIVEIVVPPSFVGKTLAEAELPRRYGLIVIGVKEAMAERWEIMPPPSHRFTEEQLLLVIGRKAQIARFCEVK